MLLLQRSSLFSHLGEPSHHKSIGRLDVLPELLPRLPDDTSTLSASPHPRHEFHVRGLWPLRNAKAAEAAIHAFGLAHRIARSLEAQSTFIIYSSRMTFMGLALYTLYFRRMYSAMDSIMLLLGWAGVVDGHIYWKEDVSGKAVFRLLSSIVVAALGAVEINEEALKVFGLKIDFLRAMVKF